MKDFDSWNDKKKKIETSSVSKFYNTREIWWCSLGINVGYEQDGMGKDYQRPVLILKGISKNTCIVIPLTTSDNEHSLRFPIGMVGGKNASALLSQIKVIDTKRLVNKVGYLEKEVFDEIRKAVRDFI